MQEVAAHYDAERGQLKDRRQPQEQATGQHLGGKPLETQHAAQDEHTGSEHDDPISQKNVERAPNAIAGGNGYGCQRDGRFASQPLPDVLRHELGKRDERIVMVHQNHRGIAARRIERVTRASGNGGIAPVSSAVLVVHPVEPAGLWRQPDRWRTGAELRFQERKGIAGRGARPTGSRGRVRVRGPVRECDAVPALRRR